MSVYFEERQENCNKVARSLLSYAMNVFLLHMDICKELQ